MPFPVLRKVVQKIENFNERQVPICLCVLLSAFFSSSSVYVLVRHNDLGFGHHAQVQQVLKM